MIVARTDFESEGLQIALPLRWKFDAPLHQRLGGLVGVYKRGDASFLIIHLRGGETFDFVNRLAGSEGTRLAIEADDGDFDAGVFIVRRDAERPRTWLR